MKKYYLVSLLTLVFCTNTHALDIIPIENTLTVIQGGKTSVVGEEGDIGFTLAKTVIAPDNGFAVIGYNREFTTISFNILSPTRSEYKIKWDNKSFMFPRFDPQSIRFLREGGTRQLSFNVTRPITGNLHIYNSNNQLLKTIPYHVKKQSRFAHGLNTHIHTNDTSGDDDQSVSIHYNISQRAPIGKPIWRGGITYRSDLNDDDGNDRSGSVFFGVSW